MIIFIYILKDPITGEVRYVGKTNNPQIRLRNHIAQRDNKTHVACWIRSLINIGVEPILEVIEQRSADDWSDSEQFWIAEYRRRGARLTNLTIGGDHGNSLRGIPCKEETKRKISEAQKGRRVPDNLRHKISRSLTGKTLSEETRRKISETLKGRPKPPRSQEHREKIAAKARGRVQSDAAKEAKSIKLKAYASTPIGIAHLSRAGKAGQAALRGKPDDKFVS